VPPYLIFIELSHPVDFSLRGSNKDLLLLFITSVTPSDNFFDRSTTADTDISFVETTISDTGRAGF